MLYPSHHGSTEKDGKPHEYS
ncbi:hypothetical protein IL54_2459 [Sphingobium sp. ba1]|nr:hypothetical protein IL54_2459 [Sphingobium sp. ba1]